ncbi:MAG TPA: D-alanine--D-alanine ligase [Candidatus Polarisedimenticolia bacterium]|nr:D-alanine--D-alanine ligase [Candidatus Polarisedimenticolia bacterium]
MKVGLTYDLKDEYVPLPDDPPDAATELDTEETIGALESAIRANGHRTVRLGNALSVMQMAQDDDLDVDLVFNISEGLDGRGREAQVPAILELLGIPYTGSDVLTMAVSLDKGMSKKIFRSERVPTPDWFVAPGVAEVDAWDVEFPLFVKPIHEGTAKGVTVQSLVKDMRSLRRQVSRVIRTYRQPALVEEYLPGREFTTGVMGTGEPAVLGTMEVIVADPAEDTIYTGTSKAEFAEKVLYKAGREIEPPLRRKVEAVALAAHRALECRDFSRVDIRCDAQGRPCCLEVNPLAGLNPRTSDLAFIARFEGISYEELIGRILSEAIGRSRRLSRRPAAAARLRDLQPGA